MKIANTDDQQTMVFTGKTGAKDAEYKNKTIVRINS